MRVLYLTLTGPADPTRASLPFHLAANGSAEVGHDVGVDLEDNEVLVFAAGRT